MKMTPDFIKANDRMKPGVISSSGFLGNDKRSLIDIIQADEELFAKFGLDWDAAAAKLQYFMEQGRKGLGDPLTVDSNWIVVNLEVRGRIPCPFADGLFPKMTTMIEFNGQKLYYSALSIHLLSVHHFLQGKGSIFRLEPYTIKQVLGL